VKSDSSISSLSDLKGRKIAFKKRDSHGGYLIPVQELEKIGLKIEENGFLEIITGNYENTISGVLQGDYDCGVVSSNFFDEVEKEKKDRLKIIHKSQSVPGGIYIVPLDADEFLLKKISEGFNQIAKDLPSNQELAGYFKVRPPNPEIYDFLEKATPDADN